MKMFLVLAMLMLANFASAKEEAKARQIVLSEENTLVLDQDFNSDSVSALIEQARKLDSKLENKHPLYLFLYTPGGSIQDGLELYEALKGLNRPVHTITLFAASMGFQTVQQLGERYILANGQLMSHKARGGFQGEFGDGMSQLDSRYAVWMTTIQDLDEHTVKRTNGKQTLKSYRSQYENEMWLRGKQAVSQGYADEVVTVKCDATMQGERQVAINFFGLNLTLGFSKCPTNVNLLSVTANVVTTKGTLPLDKFLAEGGSFGKECYEKANKSSEYSYYSRSEDNSSKEVNKTPCMIDTDLTLEKIKDTLTRAKEDRKKNIANKIIRSY